MTSMCPNILHLNHKSSWICIKWGNPAAGSYYAVLSVPDKNIYVKSNTINLEIGPTMRDVVLVVNDLKDVKITSLEKTVEMQVQLSTSPAHAKRECKWFKDGVHISSEEDLNLFIDNVDQLGEYVLQVRAWTLGSYNDALFEETINIILEEPTMVCPVIYIHDLMPGREAGFIQVGWWVIDEINAANMDGFRWQNDPMNDRFKYKCELAALAAGFVRWPALEVQESRNGYILLRKDMILPEK